MDHTDNQSDSVNVAARLRAHASTCPERMAIAEPIGRDGAGKRTYRQVTFKQLEEDSSLLADGLRTFGALPGMRIVLMVRPGIDFISLVFAMFKAGIVTVLIDPGMGRLGMVRCLQTVDPEGFVAIPLVHGLRVLLRRRFRRARLNVTAGSRWFWGGTTLRQLRTRVCTGVPIEDVRAEDPAAIIFTTGSTGPPKGVLYRHGNFFHQAAQIQEHYSIEPGEIDVPGFPLFALFNCAMGVSTVIPEMDPTRPADVDPRKFIEAVHDWDATQAFASPALWNVVGQYCETHQIQMPTLRRVLSAGAPVPPHVVRRVKQAIHPDGDLFTPYGATEALPVASVSASELLSETIAATNSGKGTCVGQRFSGIDWQVIRISDAPLESVDQVEALPVGEIGELMVSGPVVTREYVQQDDANAAHKVHDGARFWHRMGDVGYLDEKQRFWFCGRKSHRVITQTGTMYTVMCEAVFNRHPDVYRSALVGIGKPGEQTPVIIVEPWPHRWSSSAAWKRRLCDQLGEIAQQYPHTRNIRHFLIRKTLPVDIRHNAKIFREKLRAWAARHLPTP